MIKTILRYIIALIFIASGFVKAVDPVGFSFKLEEYFSPTVFNLPFFEQYALPIAVFVSILEVLLGLMLLLKVQLKKTLMALIALCVFFAFLTFYSAYFNVVTDCGCFGDAIKFTPWQSFFKDIILLVGLLVLWMYYKNEKSSGKTKVKLPLLLVGSLITFLVVYWGIKHEPIMDFRDYKVGTDLKIERQKIAQNPSEYKTFYVLKNKTTGEEKKVNQDDYVNEKDYWQEGSPWEIQKDKTTSEIVKQGYESEIVKFHPEDTGGNDLADQIISAEKAVLVFSYNPKTLSAAEIQKAENAVKENVIVYGISTDAKTFKTIPNLVMDGTAIKTIARSNPFVMVLNKGKIVEKKSLEDFINN